MNLWRQDKGQKNCVSAFLAAIEKRLDSPISPEELFEVAKEKKLLAILGLGASPGITNLLGKIAIDHLDKAHTVYTGWNLEEAQPEGVSSQKGTNAAMIHGIEQITGKVKIFKDGKFVMVNPLKEQEGVQ